MTDLQKIKIAIQTLISLDLAKNQEEVGKLMGYKSASSFSQVVNGKVSLPKNFIKKIIELNPSLDSLWKKNNSDINNIETPTINNKELKTSTLNENLTEFEPKPLVPMYNFPASASAIEMYSDPNDIKIVGHLSIPGAMKNSFALPVHGHSMYPTLESGSWGVIRPIENPSEILWGEVYYIEWGDYRNYKRLLLGDNDDEVVLWSDNQTEVVNGKPKYSPVTIKKESIRKLCLLTDILKKPNY